MQTPLPPKGTRDFYPEEMSFREHIFSSWEKTCQRYGFEKFDAPIFEHLDLYTKKSGEEIEKQLYTFEDKSNRKLSLRPEMTPSLARMVAAKGPALKKPVRWYSIPRLFRYEKMQKGRLREFFQLNVDILGVKEVTADAELIAVAIDTLRDLGLDNNDFSVHVSSRNLLEELFLQLSIPKESIKPLFLLLDKQQKLPKDVFKKELEIFLKDQRLATKVFDILNAQSFDEIVAINPSSPSVKDLQNLFTVMDHYGLADYVTFDIGIVRGLAYYTGIVFELMDKNRDLRAIAGGGRYDRLVSLYGGEDTPAAGFATGDVVLAELLKAKGIVPDQPSRSDIFIATFNRENYNQVVSLANALRQRGYSCEFPLRPIPIGKQMKLASAARSKVVIFTGGQEEKEDNIKIKDMRSGEEFLVSKDELYTKLADRLSNS